MHKEYIKEGLDHSLTHLMEECAEIIKDGCKIQRFGWLNRYPSNTSLSNLELLLNEISDVENCIKILKVELNRGSYIVD